MKQILLSLCKTCLQGSQSVETVIRIFTDLQVNFVFSLPKFCLHGICIQEMTSNPSTIGDLLADILATLGM